MQPWVGVSSQIAKARWVLQRTTRAANEWAVTSGTCNDILAALIVIATNAASNSSSLKV